MKIMLVAGARPNFMKIASIIDAIHKYNNLIENSKLKIQHCLVHTGQHYDDSMSDAFFRDLELPKPDIHLDVGSASHAVQTAEIMKRFEPILLKEQPDVVVVVGDVNSTVACSLVASKIDYYTPNSELRTKNLRRKPLIAHVEAGLRSFDRSMPEEINRILTDQLSDFLFVSEQSGIDNLKNEGFKNFLNTEDVLREEYAPRLAPHDLPVVPFVGNTMIDTLLKHREKSQGSGILNRLGLKKTEHNNSTNPTNSTNPYAILTLHRPSNVDDKETFQEILEALAVISREVPIFFPAHPRTLNRIKEFGFENYFDFISQHSAFSTRHFCIHCIEPLGYVDFLCLMSNSKLVLTDSGGIQEETTVLGIPCVTLRGNTERPVTIAHGTNILAGFKKDKIIESALLQLNGYDQIRSYKSVKLNKPNKLNEPNRPKFWDGRAGERIIKILIQRGVG
jgi:UDP-N-acetylglucosamine 2-epimerase (non-hydrolysing)